MSRAAATEADVAVSGKSQRILALDLLRGFFLLVIMIDHVELYPNLFDFFTGKGRLWVSAAEGFFFMSGLLIGMIYKRRIGLGMKFIFRKMWTRALELYVVGVGFTLLYLCWVEFTHHAPIKDSLPSPLPWHHILEQTFLMRFTYGWADFLVRFAILMLIAPFIFYLIAKRKWWLALVFIFTAWVLRGHGFTWSWQLIFNLGILIGFYWQQLESRYNSLSAAAKKRLKIGFASTAAITFTISYASVYVLSLLFHLWGDNLLPPWLQHVAYTWGNWNYDVWLYADKWTMGPIRVILFFIWFPVLFWLFRRYERRLNRATAGIMELLGRNSLLVYSLHSIIIFGLKMYVIPPKTNLLENFAITGLGLILLVGGTILIKRLQAAMANFSWLSFKAWLQNLSA
jgi:hypothetical protein